MKGPSQTIKSHHNVGGMPPDLKLELVEPLKELFKDEVRALGGDTAIMGYVAAFTAITEVPVMMFSAKFSKRWETVQYIRLALIMFVAKALAYDLAPNIPLFFLLG